MIQAYQGRPTFPQGASNRATNENLLRQLSEALDGTSKACFLALQITAHSYVQVDTEAEPAPENFQSNHNNLPTDSHVVLSALSDVFVDDLDRVELEAYQLEVSGGSLYILVYHISKGGLTAYSEGAVFLELHRRDASTQNILATFSPTVFSNDSADTDECSQLF
jgi:hypothetical protein